MEFNILDFGAKEGGNENCAHAIQAAIDAAAVAGGRVVIPHGKWLAGSILLKSNTELYLDYGAELISSLCPEDIMAFPCEKDGDAVDGWNGGFFLGARDAHDISITGHGVINGQGKNVFYDADIDNGFHECPMRVEEFRPRLMLFENIDCLRISGITLRDAAFWSLHMAGCQHVRIQRINIFNNDRGANNDGIDPDCCRDVIISDCFVETGDDAIVLKSTAPMNARYGACENILIRNCILHSRDSAIKIGSETHGIIRNVIVSDCIARDCSRGIGIWMRDGGCIESITVHHFSGAVRRYADAYQLPGAPGWWGKGEPVFISATHRRGHAADIPGIIRNICLSDFNMKCESSIFIGGEANSVIEDVHLSGFHLCFARQGTQPGGLFDEQPSERHVYPHSIPALYARFADGLQLKDSTVHFTDENEAWNGTLTETEDCGKVEISWN